MDGDLEPGLVTLMRAGKYERAATEALERYGAELYGYLIMVLGESDAAEVFAQVCEDLWKGLPGFAFRWYSPPMPPCS